MRTLAEHTQTPDPCYLIVFDGDGSVRIRSAGRTVTLSTEVALALVAAAAAQPAFARLRLAEPPF